MKTENPCNLCGATQAEIVSTVDRDGEPLRTVMCAACGLVFTDPRPAPHQVENYYRTQYRVDYKRSVTPKKKHLYRNAKVALARLRFLERFLSAHARVLDVGSGAGEFVFALKANDYDVCGIEPNEGFGNYARHELGLPVDVRFIEGDSPSPNPFNLITMFHVLEHVEDPRGTLEVLRRWLAPHGKIVIEVPNIEATCSSPKHRFHQAHLYNFNLCTLRRLGETTGFRVLAQQTSSDGGTISIILERCDNCPPLQHLQPHAEDNAARVRRHLNAHTQLRYLTSAHPYRRIFNKAAQYTDEYLYTNRFQDNLELLRDTTKQKNRKP